MPTLLVSYFARLHTITVAGKEVTKQFYERPHTTSYFFGCSQGGRQGVHAAEKYPDDFDGIVAGSPALDFNNLISWRASFYPITGPASGPNFIPPTTWAGLIHDEVLKQCDGLDGLEDGIIEAASTCNFNPEPLLCENGAAPPACLTEPQLAQVRRIFLPLKFPGGEIIYSPMNPGSETRAIDRLYAGRPFSDSQDWFRYVIYSNPNFDPLSWTVKDAMASRDMNPFDIRTYPLKLDAFRAHDGKLLVYHGQQDQQITSLNTQRWYDDVAAMNGGPGEVDEWMRFFRISGMNHCAGGPGAWRIGQSQAGAEGSLEGPAESRSNVLAAIVGWVEEDIAPEGIEGSGVSGEGKVFRRKHCR